MAKRVVGIGNGIGIDIRKSRKAKRGGHFARQFSSPFNVPYGGRETVTRKSNSYIANTYKLLSKTHEHENVNYYI